MSKSQKADPRKSRKQANKFHFHKYLRSSRVSKTVIKTEASSYLFCLARTSSFICNLQLPSRLAVMYIIHKNWFIIYIGTALFMRGSQLYLAYYSLFRVNKGILALPAKSTFFKQTSRKWPLLSLSQSYHKPPRSPKGWHHPPWETLNIFLYENKEKRER